MTPREIVRRAVRFEKPERLPRGLPDQWGNDFAGVGMDPSPDMRPRGSGVDEWGCVWENIGVCNLGEVKEHPLTSWDDFDTLPVPDIHDPARWTNLPGARERAGDRFLMAGGISLYERVHFIRGLENTWCDIYEHPDQLKKLIDILVGMNVVAIEKYASTGADGFMFCDDWGLQHRLMINPEKWREIWKPAYTRVYAAAHEAGMLTFLHSCGDIVEILDDLVEAGLDCIQMDQQVNMGLENLGRRFRGRITFYCPVDIQAVMPHAPMARIREYVHEMVTHLGTPEGGFICKWYGDPTGAGHTPEAIEAMCDEFVHTSVDGGRVE